MQNRRAFLTTTIVGALAATAQTTPPVEGEHISARSGPIDYQAQAKAGDYTIAADFVAHAVPTPAGTFTSEDYVAVEVAFYGPANSKLTIAFSDFSLKINDRKMPIPGQPNGAALRGLSDPEWQPPKVEDDKSKRQPGDPPPATPKMPFERRRAMEQKVKRAAIPEGERVLPVAGLVFFPYRGKDESIHNLKLYYNGAAGSATLKFER